MKLKQFSMAFAVCISFAPFVPSHAIRGFDRIETPADFEQTVEQKVEPLSDRSQKLSSHIPRRPVTPERVTQAVHTIADSWNKGDLEQYLSEAFPNRQDLLDTVDQSVPTDAILRITGVSSISTLHYEFTEIDGTLVLLRIVTATVASQIEFNDPATGYQKLTGRYEWILRFRDSVDK